MTRLGCQKVTGRMSDRAAAVTKTISSFSDNSIGVIGSSQSFGFDVRLEIVVLCGGREGNSSVEGADYPLVSVPDSTNPSMDRF